jgi:hypothetical protein
MVNSAENNWRLEEMGPTIVVDLCALDYVKIINELLQSPTQKLTYPYETYLKVIHELAHYFQVVSSPTGFFNNFILQQKLKILKFKYPSYAFKFERPSHLWFFSYSMDNILGSEDIMNVFAQDCLEENTTISQAAMRIKTFYDSYLADFEKKYGSPEKEVYPPPEEMGVFTIRKLLDFDGGLYDMKQGRKIGADKYLWHWYFLGITRSIEKQSRKYTEKSKQLDEKELIIMKIFEELEYLVNKAKRILVNNNEFVFRKTGDNNTPSNWSIMEAFATEVTFNTMQQIFRVEKNLDNLDEMQSNPILEKLMDERKANEAFFPNCIANASDYPIDAISNIQAALCEVALMDLDLGTVPNNIFDRNFKERRKFRYESLIRIIDKDRFYLIKAHKRGIGFEGFCKLFTKVIDKMSYRKALKKFMKNHSRFVHNNMHEFKHLKFIKIFLGICRIKYMQEDLTMDLFTGNNVVNLMYLLVRERVDIIAICNDGYVSTKSGLLSDNLGYLRALSAIVHEQIIDDFCNKTDFERSRQIYFRIFQDNGPSFSEFIKDSPIYDLIINSEPTLNDDFSISGQ